VFRSNLICSYFVTRILYFWKLERYISLLNFSFPISAFSNKKFHLANIQLWTRKYASLFINCWLHADLLHNMPKYFKLNKIWNKWLQLFSCVLWDLTLIRARVRRSLSVRSETKRKWSKKLFASKRKNVVFSLVSLRSEKLEIISETKTNEAK
jgi:hypothetical protein